MSATSGGGGSVSENSDAGESSQSTMSIRDSPSTSFQGGPGNENVTNISLTEGISTGNHAGEMIGSKINLTMDGKDQSDGVVNMGFDYEEASKTGEGDFASINGSSKKDKVPEAVNLELVNMVPYSNGNGTSYGVPINGIPTKKDSETVDMSTPYDEYFVPVNEHKKYMRGEKLYVTKDKRRPTSWRRCLSWVIACIVIAAVLIVAILAGTGVIMSQEQNMVKEASVGRNFAGANLKPLVTEESSSKTSLPKMTEPWPSPSTDMTYLNVPKTIESELTIDNLSLNPALLNQNSTEYQEFVAMMERNLIMILFNKEILDFGESQVGLKVVNISQDPFKLIYRIGWQNKEGSNSQSEPIEMENVKNRLLESLKANQGYIDKYHIDLEKIKVGHVINNCKMDNNGCSHICYYNYLNQRFTCTCPTHLVLDSSEKNCVEWTGSSEQDYASVPEHIQHHSSHEEEMFGFHHSEMGHVENGNISGQFEMGSNSEPEQNKESDANSALYPKHHETHFTHQPLPDDETEPSPESTSKPSSFEPTVKSPADQSSNVDSKGFERNQGIIINHGPHSPQEESTELVTQHDKEAHFHTDGEKIEEHQHHIHGTNLGHGDETRRQMVNSQGQHNEDLLNHGQIKHDHQGPFYGFNERTDNKNNKPTTNIHEEHNQDSNTSNEEQMRQDHLGHFYGTGIGFGNENNQPTEKTQEKPNQDSTQPGIINNEQFNQESNPLYEGEVKRDHQGNFHVSGIGFGNANNQATEKTQEKPNQDSTEPGIVDDARIHQESNPLKGDQSGYFQGANLEPENKNDGQIINQQREQNQGIVQPGNREILQSNQESSSTYQQQDYPAHYFQGAGIGSGNENYQPSGKTQGEQNQDSVQPGNKENSQFNQESSPFNQGEMKHDHHHHFLNANVGSNNQNDRNMVNIQEHNQDSHLLSEGQMKDNHSGQFQGAGIGSSNENYKPTEKIRSEQNQDSIQSGILDTAQLNEESNPLYEAEMKHGHSGHFHGADIVPGNENERPTEKTPGEKNQNPHSLNHDQMKDYHLAGDFHAAGVEPSNKNGRPSEKTPGEQNLESNPLYQKEMTDDRNLDHIANSNIGSGDENYGPKINAQGEHKQDSSQQSNKHNSEFSQESNPLHESQMNDPGRFPGTVVDSDNENQEPRGKTHGKQNQDSIQPGITDNARFNQKSNPLNQGEMKDGHHLDHFIGSNIGPGNENYRPHVNAQEHNQDSSPPSNKSNLQFNQESNSQLESQTKDYNPGHFQEVGIGPKNENNRPAGKTQGEQNQNSNLLHQNQLKDDHPGHFHGAGVELGNENYGPTISAQGEHNQDSSPPSNKNNSQFSEESNPLHESQMKDPGHFSGTVVGSGNENQEPRANSQEQNQDSNLLYQNHLKDDHPGHFHGAGVELGNENYGPTISAQGEHNQDSSQPSNKNNSQFSEESNPLHESHMKDPGHFSGTVAGSDNENQEPTGKIVEGNVDVSQPSNKKNAQFNQESNLLYEEQIKHDHPDNFHLSGIGSSNENNQATEKSSQGEQNQGSTQPGTTDNARFTQESNQSYQGEMKGDQVGHFFGANVGSENERNQPTEKGLGVENQDSSQPSNKNNAQVNQESIPLYQGTMKQGHPNIGPDYDNAEAIMKSKLEPALETTTYATLENNTTMSNSEKSNRAKEPFNFNDSPPYTTSNPLGDSNFKTTYNPSVESNTEHLLNSVPQSKEMLNTNNLRVSENESKNEGNQTVEEPKSDNLGVKEHNVPLLEDILLRGSSWNSSASQINLTEPTKEKNWLKNVEVNSQNHPVVEEIVIEKPSSQEKKMPEILSDNNHSGKEDAATVHDDLTNYPHGDSFKQGNDQNVENKKDPNVPETHNYETKSNIKSQHDLIQDGGVENEVKDNSSANSNKQQEVNKFEIVEDKGTTSDSIEKSSTDRPYLIDNHENGSSSNPQTLVFDKSHEPTELSSHEINVNTSRQPVSEHGTVTENVKLMSHLSENTDPFISSKEVNIKDQNSKELKEVVRPSENSEPATENPAVIAQSQPNRKGETDIEGSEQPKGQPIQKESTNESDKPVVGSNENFGKTEFNISGMKNTEKTIAPESEITTTTPKNLILQEVTVKNIVSTEINRASEEIEKQNDEVKFTTNYSNNIKGEGADNEEFNTLLDKDDVTKNDNGNDNKEVKVNKYPNKQIFLKGDKKKLKDFVKSDKGDVDKKIIYETTRPSITPEDFVLQKHVNGNDNDFSSDLQSHTEEISRPTKNITVVDIPHLDNVPGVLFQNEGIDGGDFKILQTITPDYKSEIDHEQERENLRGDFKTKGTEAKEGDFKTEKDYPKFEKDYKYDKQKGGKKKDLKKKGGVKDGKNVELIEGRKYTDGLGKDENIRDETSDEITARDSSEIFTSSLPESVTIRSENTNSPAFGTSKSFNEAHATETPKVSEIITINHHTESNQPTLAINRMESSVEGEPVQNFKTGEQIPTIVPTVKVQEHLPIDNGEANVNFDNLPNDKNFNNNGFASRDNNNPHNITVEEKNGSKVTETAKEYVEGSTKPTNIEIIQPFVISSTGGGHETGPNNPVLSTEGYISAKTVVEDAPKLLKTISDSMQESPTIVPEVVANKSRFEINRYNNNINGEQGSFFAKLPSSNESIISVTLFNNTSPGTVFDGISNDRFPNGENYKVTEYPAQSFENLSTSFRVPSPSSGFTTEDILTPYKFSIPNHQRHNISYHTIVVQGPSEGAFDGHDTKFVNNSFTYFTGNPSMNSLRPNITYVGSDPRFNFGNHSYLFQNRTLSHPSVTIGGRENGVKYVFNGSAIANGSDFTSFLDSLFPSSKTVKNSSIYRIENSSLPGTVFDGHFIPHEGYYHMFTNSSGTFAYTNDTNQPTFAIQGQSGDFGNSTLYLLKNVAAPSKPGALLKNTTKYTIGNITTTKTFFIPKNITSSIISNNSSPFISFTPTSFSSGSAYQVNDYFGYISKCASGQFQCINGTSKKGSPCINLSSKCDSINDCSDGSDEIGCIENGCPGNFQCSDGTCLKRHLVCNGITDCNDGSDETNCENRQCEFDELRCSSGRCIPIVWHCDGKPDCGNHTDEINCQLSCGNDEFMCPEGWCIPLTYKCNGIKECAEGEDEQFCDCSQEEFKCEAGGCVSKNQVCNGIDDCPDRSDEWNCFKLEENSTRLLIRSLSGEYHTVCSDNWNVERSNEVCASMGYFSSAPQEDENTSTISTEKLFYVLKNDTTEVYNNNVLNNLVQTNECSSGKLVHISCQEFTCGSRSMTDGINYEPRLIGGMTASASQWPSVALLHNVRNFLSCTANILTPRWVLASYNCLKGNSKNVNQQDWKLFSGSDVFEAEKESKENRQIKKIVPHPQIKFNQFLFSNDVALLELDQPLQFSSTVGAVCLPEEEIQPRQICVTVGWGINNPTDKKIKQQFQYLPVPTMSLQECNSTEHYSGFISDDKICAGYNDAKKSLCYNDEGAPLMCVNDRGEWEVQGVLSYHSNCGRGSHPSIFSSIMPVKKWIKETTGNRFERKRMAAKR